jgi:hypothetical protein
LFRSCPKHVDVRVVAIGRQIRTAVAAVAAAAAAAAAVGTAAAAVGTAAAAEDPAVAEAAVAAGVTDIRNIMR